MAVQTVLIDTDVFSFIFRRDRRAELYRSHVDGCLAAVSFQTVGELLQGAYMGDWGERRLGELRAEVSKYVVVPFDWPMVEVFARIRAQRRKSGREIAVADAWIAATALSLDCPVITHNVRDFADIPGLIVISELERQP